jgi:hypothetical protein
MRSSNTSDTTSKPTGARRQLSLPFDADCSSVVPDFLRLASAPAPPRTCSEPSQRSSDTSKPWVPHPYQRRAVKWLIEHPEAALFLDPGLGKTAIFLKAFVAMQKAGSVTKALVACPLRPAELVWAIQGEIGKWSDFKHLRVALLHGPDREDELERDADIYVVNFDGFDWLTRRNMAKPLAHRIPVRSLLRRGVDCLIVDELSKLKHPKARRCKLIKPHLGSFRRRWGGTGSPAANGLIDLFGEIKIIDLGKRLGEFITHYRNKYFYPTGLGGFTYLPQPGADKRIYAQLRDVALSMRATDYLDLPELVEQNVWVDLPSEAQQAYFALEADLLYELDQGTISAANAAVATTKLRQVTGGACYEGVQPDPVTGLLPEVRGPRRVLHIHDAKVEAFVDLVEELQGQPLLVAYAYQHELERLLKAVKGSVAFRGSKKEVSEIIRAWNAGEISTMFVHPQSAGHGLNLQGSNCGHVAWFTPTYDLDLYMQTNCRSWRQGNQSPAVIIHRFLARDTIDEAVVKALSTKRRGQAALMEALRDHAATFTTRTRRGII